MSPSQEVPYGTLDLLSLQWRDVQCDAARRARALVLRAGKTKTGTLRVVPVGQRLAAVLEMLRTDPEGETRAERHNVRDFRGHTNLATTSRHLRSTALRLERALRVLEESQGASEHTLPMVRQGDCGWSGEPNFLQLKPSVGLAPSPGGASCRQTEAWRGYRRTPPWNTRSIRTERPS